MIKSLKNQKGFTLVELIVVLVIIAILAAVAIPSLAGYFGKTKKAAVIVECREAVTAAQTLYSENHGSNKEITVENIKALAEVPGTISDIEAPNDVVVHLTYTKNPWVVTYCRDYKACSLHDETYNFEGSGGNSGDPGNPGGTTNTVGYFYLNNDPNYRVTTIGDLDTYDFGLYGTKILEGSVFYWKGDYYYTRDDQYLTNSSDRTAYINSYGVKINTNQFITPGPSTAPGDVKLVNNSVYVFFPYQRFANDYLDDNYWFPVTIEP
jgi:type IV pilus assembly protein PilA